MAPATDPTSAQGGAPDRGAASSTPGALASHDATAGDAAPRRRVVRSAGRLALALLALGAAVALTTAWFDARSERRFPSEPTGLFEARWIEADGVRLRYLEAGAGPPVVFLHGAYGGAEDVVATLGPDLAPNFRVLSFDRPGHGYSERGGARHDTPYGQAATVAAAFERLGLERPTVVGFSYGGAVAAALATAQPERVGALVLVAAPLLPWGGDASPADRVLATPWLGPACAWLGGSLAARLIAPSELAAAFEPEAVALDHAVSPVDLALRPGALVANARDLLGLSDELAVQSEAYDALRAPVVLVHGRSDPVVWYDHHAEPLAARWSGADLRLIDGAGHQLLYTRTAAVVDAVRDAARLAHAAGTGH